MGEDFTLPPRLTWNDMVNERHMSGADSSSTSIQNSGLANTLDLLSNWIAPNLGLNQRVYFLEKLHEDLANSDSESEKSQSPPNPFLDDEAEEGTVEDDRETVDSDHSSDIQVIILRRIKIMKAKSSTHKGQFERFFSRCLPIAFTPHRQVCSRY